MVKMPSALSSSIGELSFVSSDLVCAMALARIAASAVSRSSLVSVSAGSAKVASSCMGSEPPEGSLRVRRAPREILSEIERLSYPREILGARSEPSSS